MTSTTTTISSETIRLAAAYDDKSHEGVGFPKIQLSLAMADDN